jgi:hypothetical protein
VIGLLVGYEFYRDSHRIRMRNNGTQISEPTYCECKISIHYTRHHPQMMERRVSLAESPLMEQRLSANLRQRFGLCASR